MTEPAGGGVGAPAPLDPLSDQTPHHDRVRWRYIEALARRAAAQQGALRRLLDGKLAAALAAYRRDFEQRQDEARATIARGAGQFPAAADELQRLFDAADFAALARLVARLESRPAPLAGLLAYHAQRSPDADAAGRRVASGARGEISEVGELRAIRQFRDTWAKLSVARQLAQAIDQAPENAGPLNSQRLVLSSLASMRDNAPDYLNRFVSYVDTLLALEQAETSERPAAKATRRPPAAKIGKAAKAVKERTTLAADAATAAARPRREPDATGN